MSQIIRLTTSATKQQEVARAFIRFANEIGCQTAVIGGLALALLGSERTTQMNILIKLPENLTILALREAVKEKDKLFVDHGLHLYKIDPEEHSNLEVNPDVRSLLQHGQNNVLVETLPTGQLGLPLVAGPLLETSLSGLPVLHPKVLILTKLKRWSAIQDSTRPKTMLKARSDLEDVKFLVNFLAEKQEHVAFDEYAGKPREALLKHVGVLWEHFVLHEDTDSLETLQKVLKPDDLEALQQQVGDNSEL
ncbi:hypothetical protein VNI00_011418 [Paramarasmius palmivorus]|uniref:Uncharacterized protein n=1 Tax=Paramarasmius palmivorus TaxID=297713 RepID=A0AAW0CBL0_9AGAR